MCIYIYIYMYTYTCVYTYICIYVYVYICVCIYKYMYSRSMYVHIYIYIYVYEPNTDHTCVGRRTRPDTVAKPLTNTRSAEHSAEPAFGRTRVQPNTHSAEHAFSRTRVQQEPNTRSAATRIGAKYRTPEIKTSEMIVEFRLQFPMDVQWHSQA